MSKGVVVTSVLITQSEASVFNFSVFLIDHEMGQPYQLVYSV